MNISKTGYNQTEIKGIPQDWKVVRLEHIATKIDAGQTAPQGKEYFENGKFPFIRVKHLNYIHKGKYIVNSDLINEKAISEYKLRLFPKGSIIFPKSGESIRLERRAILKEDSYVVNHLCVVISNKAKINSLSLFYYLAGVRISRLLTQTTTPSINLSQIKKIRISIPSFLEQQKIADVLCCVDDAIQRTNEVVEKTKMLKRGLMQRLLSRGIGHTRFKQTPLGKIPDTWEINNYKQVTNRITYGFTNPMPHVDSGHYLITAKDIIDGRINYETARKTSEEAFTQLLTNKSRPEIGDVLITKDGTLGRVAIVDQEGICINQSVAVLKPKTAKISTNYLYWSLQSPTTKRYIKNEASVTTIGHISITKLGKWKFALPPIEEQNRISEILFSAKRHVDQTKLRKKELERLKKGLMQVLLTGKVRVKVA